MRKIALTIGLFLVFFGIPQIQVQAQSDPPAGCERGLEFPIGNKGYCPTEGRILCGDSSPMHDVVTYCCDPGVACPSGSTPPNVSQSYKVCDAVGDVNQRSDCFKCMAPEDGSIFGTWTAIGCIKTGTDNPEEFLGTLIKLGVGIAGGIAFLLILFGGLQIMTSAGNPEQLNSGRELVSAAITGLILIIFSIFLLEFIGVNIIGIPRFGG